MLFEGARDERDGRDRDRGDGGGPETWSRWLDRNERETWQMELLVSGFVIVLLAQVLIPLNVHLNEVRANVGDAIVAEVLVVGATFVMISGVLLTVASLSINVLLRGLWIGAVGLRSVSGPIELGELRLAPRFDRFLRRRLPDFDAYIYSLERLSSSVFGLAFLSIFVLVGFVVAAVAIAVPMVLLAQVFGEAGTPTRALRIFYGVFGAVASLVALLAAVDFFSGSWLKRSRWLSVVYYPVYRVVGWLTLARVYRPLYYNLVDTRFGRRLVLAIVPYFLVLGAIVGYSGESQTPLVPRRGDIGFGHAGAYGRSDVNYFPGPFLEDDVLAGPYARLYIPLEWNGGVLAVRACDSAGAVALGASASGGSVGEVIDEYRQYVGCLGDYYRLDLDGRRVSTGGFITVEYGTTELSCLSTLVPLDSVAAGAHYLNVWRRGREEGHWVDYATIPFLLARASDVDSPVSD